MASSTLVRAQGERGARTTVTTQRPPTRDGSAMKNHQPTTHDRLLHAVRGVVIAHARERGMIAADQAERLADTKLL